MERLGMHVLVSSMTSLSSTQEKSLAVIMSFYIIILIIISVSLGRCFSYKYFILQYAICRSEC